MKHKILKTMTISIQIIVISVKMFQIIMKKLNLDGLTHQFKELKPAILIQKNKNSLVKKLD